MAVQTRDGGDLHRGAEHEDDHEDDHQDDHQDGSMEG